jgi:hypothetical protein
MARLGGPPPLVFVQRLWRVHKPESVTVLSCGLYLASVRHRSEMWIGNEENLLMSQVSRTRAEAQARADQQPVVEGNRSSQVPDSDFYVVNERFHGT